MLKLSSIIKLFSVVCVAGLITACGGSAETSKVRDTVVVANGADAKTLDPHASNDLPSYRVSHQIYSQLVLIQKLNTRIKPVFRFMKY